MSRTSRLLIVAIGLAVAIGAAAVAQTTRPFKLALTGGEYIQIEDPLSANIVYTSVNALRDGRDYVYQTPASGFTLNMTGLQSVVTLNPAATLASGTINFPATKLDGRVATIFSTQAITALTVGSQGAGTTILNAPTSLPANQAYDFIYMASLNAWTRYQ